MVDLKFDGNTWISNNNSTTCYFEGVEKEMKTKQFEFDMAANRVEQLNKEIGEGGQHD